MQVQLHKSFTFEAAHRHPAPGNATETIHGHRFHVEVFVTGPVGARTGWLLDYADIKSAVNPVLERLDHRFLNEIPGLEHPTRDQLESWVQKEIEPMIEFPVGVRVSCREARDPEMKRLPPGGLFDLPERATFRFESAHSLPNTPQGHKCRRLHGHSYRGEIGLADLEGKERFFNELFRILDHNHLNEIEGLENPTAENLCDYLWEWCRDRGETPTCVGVFETCESSCVYRGG